MCPDRPCHCAQTPACAIIAGVMPTPLAPTDTAALPGRAAFVHGAAAARGVTPAGSIIRACSLPARIRFIRIRRDR